MTEIIIRKARREDCKTIRALIQVNFVNEYRMMDEYGGYYIKIFFIGIGGLWGDARWTNDWL